MSRDKRAALGVCDLCGEPIPAADWYTSKGRPRLHCSIDCRQTDNSRIGAPIRARKAKRRVALGTWVNPASIRAPDPDNVSAGLSRMRKAEVKAGTWRNPALTPAARRKLSRPRKYSGDLASAIEKLSRGSVADLTETEHTAWLRHQKYKRDARLDADRAYQRARYRARQAALTEAEREAQRARWRAQNKRRK